MVVVVVVVVTQSFRRELHKPVEFSDSSLSMSIVCQSVISVEDRLLKLAALAKAYVALPIMAVAWRAVYFSECNSLHQCLLFINTRFLQHLHV